MSIKQYTVFRCFLQLSAKYWVKQFYKTVFLTSHSKEWQKLHTPYADTDVLQTLCVDRVLRSGLKNGICNQGRTNFASSIVSLDIFL